MKLRKRYLLILVGGALCLFLLILIYLPDPPSKSLQTRVLIRNIYQELLRINEEGESDIRQLLHSKGEERCLSRLLCDLIKEPWVKYSQSNLVLFKNNSIIDAWGNSLCVAWRSDITTKATIGLLNSVDCELIIWSSGKNGVNEFGDNDDVYFGMSWVMKQARKIEKSKENP